jgi:hypothetical protein
MPEAMMAQLMGEREPLAWNGLIPVEEDERLSPAEDVGAGDALAEREHGDRNLVCLFDHLEDVVDRLSEP